MGSPNDQDQANLEKAAADFATSAIFAALGLPSLAEVVTQGDASMAGDDAFIDGIDCYTKLELVGDDLDDALGRMYDKASSDKHPEVVKRGEDLYDRFADMMARLDRLDGVADDEVKTYVNDVEAIVEEILGLDADDEYQYWTSAPQVAERKGVLSTLSNPDDPRQKQRYDEIVAFADDQGDYDRANREWQKFMLELRAGATDGGFAIQLAVLNSPEADAIAEDLQELRVKFDGLKKPGENEEKGQGRDDLVDGIAAARARIDKLGGGELDSMALAEVKTHFYETISEITPYYLQGTNVDLLEGPKQYEMLFGKTTDTSTRTCNLTCLAMALESLGKTAANFDSARLARVKQVHAEVEGHAELQKNMDKPQHQVKGKTNLQALRLPDFLQFAAVAEYYSAGGTLKDAVSKAWETITDPTIFRSLGRRFGVKATAGVFKYEPPSGSDLDPMNSDTVRGRSKGTRKLATQVADARNRLEQATTEEEREQRQAKYDQALKAFNKKKTPKNKRGLSSEQDEEKLPLAIYRQQIHEQVGVELERGAAVIAYLRGHYTRLQSLHDDHFIVDDPGRGHRANMKITYEEARKMGYFFKWMALK